MRLIDCGSDRFDYLLPKSVGKKCKAGAGGLPMCPDVDAVQCLVVGLSSQQMYRDLFWLSARVGPVSLGILVACLAMPRYRRSANASLLAGAAGALAFAPAFHYTYAVAIWGGHASAIQDLDTSALWAGFTTGGVICACSSAIIAGVSRARAGNARSLE